MIRLTLALLATMALTFAVAGVDRGQVRYGLMATGRNPVAAETSTPRASSTPAPAEDIAQAVFEPTPALVVDTPAEPATDSSQIAAIVAEVAAETAREPDKLVLFVAVNTANVREGPSTEFPVIEKLTRGEAVSVLAASDEPDGWTLIAIEGDGLQGYVSNELLADQP
jgi:uncharacterized protein YgiM (DUF1202 family)